MMPRRQRLTNDAVEWTRAVNRRVLNTNFPSEPGAKCFALGADAEV